MVRVNNLICLTNSNQNILNVFNFFGNSNWKLLNPLSAEYTQHENMFLHSCTPKVKPQVGEIEKW